MKIKFKDLISILFCDILKVIDGKEERYFYRDTGHKYINENDESARHCYHNRIVGKMSISGDMAVMILDKDNMCFY